MLRIGLLVLVVMIDLGCAENTKTVLVSHKSVDARASSIVRFRAHFIKTEAGWELVRKEPLDQSISFTAPAQVEGGN